MNNSVSYKTKQRELILGYMIDNKDNHVTVNQISNYLVLNDTPVGISTIYRHLEKLLEQGLVRKYTVDNSTGACFQYAPQNDECHQHFHLKCEKCGCLIHIECDYLNNLCEHIYDDHGFQLNPFRTVLYGICKNCADI